MKTLRGTLGGYNYNEKAEQIGIVAQLENQRPPSFVDKNGRRVFEEGEYETFDFQPGKRLDLPFECRTQLHDLTVDDTRHLVSIECKHPPGPSPPL